MVAGFPQYEHAKSECSKRIRQKLHGLLWPSVTSVIFYWLKYSQALPDSRGRHIDSISYGRSIKEFPAIKKIAILCSARELVHLTAVKKVAAALCIVIDPQEKEVLIQHWEHFLKPTELYLRGVFPIYPISQEETKNKGRITSLENIILRWYIFHCSIHLS